MTMKMHNSKTTILKSVSGIVAAVTFSTIAAHAEPIAIMNANVHTISGDMIEDGDVIVENGVITAVGPDLTVPSDATVIDAAGKVVTPGFIAPFSPIGLQEIGLDAESNDSRPDRGVGFPLGASLNAADAYNRWSTLIPVNRAGGITRALSAPSPGDTLFGGRAALIDLSGRINSVMKEDAAQILAMGFGGASRAGGTRMGAWAVLRETLDEAAIYASAPNAYASRAREDRFAIADLRALGPVLSGEQPLMVMVQGEADIRNLIRLKNDFRLNVIIVGGAEAWRAAPSLAAAQIPVLINPMFNLPAQFEALSATLENAARLEAAGVTIGFYAPEGSPAHNLRSLTQQAGNAVANGLSYEGALAALTAHPAAMFDLSDDLGTIEVGKIADIVVWDGDPLELTTKPEFVLIDGVQQDLTTRQDVLAKRYRDLSTGDLPFAYRGGE